MPDKKTKKQVMFLDFDNTITNFDILDDMLERFSANDEWIKLEDKWKNGEIGSRQCLDGQMRGIKITRNRLNKYLKTIKLDPNFKKLLKFCDANDIKKIILSDNFGYILKGILKNNGIDGLDVYCNSLKITKDSLEPSFPYTDMKCGSCAHCKTKNLLANTPSGYESIYIGDGLSDVCPSKEADLVFAKSALMKNLKADKVPYVSFDDLGDVYEYLKRRKA